MSKNNLLPNTHQLRIVQNKKTLETADIPFSFNEIAHKYGGIFNMHGHTGRTVAKLANKTINKLLDEGIEKKYCDAKDYRWYSGLGMTENERKSVYIYYMSKLRSLGELYQKAYFYFDRVVGITQVKEETSEFDSFGKDPDEDFIQICLDP